MKRVITLRTDDTDADFATIHEAIRTVANGDAPLAPDDVSDFRAGMIAKICRLYLDGLRAPKGEAKP